MDTHTLPKPARYFPVSGGIYRVEANLNPLGTDFGNGPRDAMVVQIDDTFPAYRKNKLDCRSERLSKYYANADFDLETQKVSTAKLRQILLTEYPQYFQWMGQNDHTGTFFCVLTQEKLHFESGIYRRVEGENAPEYQDGFDALVCQIPEDVAVVRRNGDRDWLAAVHLCAAGHWAAEAKVGRNFVEVHNPVPHIGHISKASKAMVHAMISKGPFTRFVWGFGSDRRLNHHPEAPPGIDPVRWKGRSFNLEHSEDESPFYLRVERQITLGIPNEETALFFIRVYYIDGREIRSHAEERDKLLMSLKTMDPESRQYKGLKESMPALLNWLTSVD